MSSAHRPTWDPAQGKSDTRHQSKHYSSRDLASHTHLKFRQPAQGGVQPSSRDINAEDAAPLRRDLKRELELAERAARDKKRKALGLAPEEEEKNEEGEVESEEAKRRKLIEQVRELDRDDDDESDDDDGEKPSNGKGKGKERADSADENGNAAAGAGDSDDSDSDSDSDDDEEDDTAALLRELEKIKRERAEEKARQERERAETEQGEREDSIALGNPLLNLQNAMAGGAKGGSAAARDFGIKRRWDDDVIFKNQAAGNESGKPSDFVNDLTRTEFHRKFMQRYIK